MGVDFLMVKDNLVGTVVGVVWKVAFDDPPYLSNVGGLGLSYDLSWPSD